MQLNIPSYSMHGSVMGILSTRQSLCSWSFEWGHQLPQWNDDTLRCHCTPRTHPDFPRGEMTSRRQPCQGFAPWTYRPFALKGNDRLDQPSIFRWELLVSERRTDCDLLWHESWPNESSSVSLSRIWWRFWRKNSETKGVWFDSETASAWATFVNLACVPQSNVDIPFFGRVRAITGCYLYRHGWTKSTTQSWS